MVLWLLMKGLIWLRKSRLIFKVNFEIAYDSLSWDFMSYMLVIFWVKDKWMSWINVYIFVGNFKVLLMVVQLKKLTSKRS